MKYYEITFTLTPCFDDARDILSALAGEAGCESFEETADGLKAYIQQQLYDASALQEVVGQFPFNTVHIDYDVREAEDRDWNEQWEQEGFEPIVIRGERLEVRGERNLRGERKEVRGKRYDCIVIHDGRHLPEELISHPSPLTTHLLIEIDAHQAFGTGTHETTRMICARLLDMQLDGKRILDCGSGTGILGICALKLGAASCTAYDIDEWSTDNTRHNAVINQVDDRLTALCGDATVIDGLTDRYDVVLANINRNILLHDMPRFKAAMAPGATLILSGFYHDDCPLLEEKAQQLGLVCQGVYTDSDWTCMVFSLK
jgi:ribosomal protein L11 methyltransferase